MADERKESFNPSSEQILEIQFIQYVSLLANSAMQHLGKLMNPVTGEMERNLDAAKATIDIIAMLKEKTKGNLSKNEEDVISNALANLQLNYVDEASRPDEPSPSEESASEVPEGEESEAGEESPNEEDSHREDSHREDSGEDEKETSSEKDA